MELNLADINLKNIKRLNGINNSFQLDFQKTLNQIFKINKWNKKLLFSNIFSRENKNNSFYFDLCKLLLIDQLVKKKKIKKIIVDKPILKKIIKKKYPRILIESSTGRHSSDNLNILFKLIRLVIYCIKAFRLRSRNRFNSIIKAKKIILFETFLIDELFTINNFTDRYSLSVKKILPEKLKKNIFFYCNLLINKNLFEKVNLAQNKLGKIILISDFFKLQDYIILIFKSFNFCSSKKINFRKYNLDILINYHLKKDNFDLKYFLSIANFIFFKKLYKNNIDLSLVLDWYENQPIDKGFNLGKNTFFPKVKSKGYVGFITDFSTQHIHLPSKFDEDNFLLPNQILVTGMKIKKYFSKYHKKLLIKIVPALRNQYFYNQKKEKLLKLNNKIKKILVILSSDNDEANEIINILDNLDKKILNKIKILIRPHPLTDLRLLKKNSFINISKKTSLQKLILQSDLIVSGGSTAVFDSYLQNKLIIIIGGKNTISKNPLYICKSKKNWKICYTLKEYEAQFCKLIKNQLKGSKINKKNILKTCFQKINKQNTKNFYN